MAKILVIDDEEQLRYLLTRILTRDGHEVFIAQDGEEGVEKFYQLKPELVITDIVMPNKDGLDVIAEILAIHPNQPIIAMSGGRRAYNTRYNIEAVEMQNIKGTLQKPFNHQEVKEMVQLALNQPSLK